MDDPIVRVDGREYDRATVTTIVVPEGITGIGDWEFRSCSKLKSISLPNSLYSIGRGAFWHYRSIESINIPPSVAHIEFFAFDSCSSLAIVNVHPSTYIDPRAFVGSKIGELAFAQNLSDVEYIRLQFRIKQDRINLRVAVHMCTNSKIAHDLNVVQPQLDTGRVIADGELDGVLAKTLLIDDVWRRAIEFL